MTWSYSGDPAHSELDQVRFEIQDVRADRALLSDEEITFLIERQRPLYDDPVMAAIHAAEIIAARYAGEVSISADGVSIDSTGLREAYLSMAGQLREQRASLVGVAPEPYAGGMDPAEDRGDAGLAPKEFGTGMTDNPRAGRQDYGSQRGSPFYPEQVSSWWG